MSGSTLAVSVGLELSMWLPLFFFFLGHYDLYSSCCLFSFIAFFCVKSSKLFKKCIQDLVDKMDSGMAFLLKMSPGLEQSICGCPVFT